jgi:hypothetical protein
MIIRIPFTAARICAGFSKDPAFIQHVRNLASQAGPALSFVSRKAFDAAIKRRADRFIDLVSMLDGTRSIHGLRANR